MEDIQLNILVGILLFIIITVFVTRFFVKRKVKRMMMAMSDEQRTDSLPEQGSDEVLAKHPLTFVELNASSEMAEAEQLRESLITRARLLFRRAFRYDIVAGFGYLLIPIIIGGGDLLEDGIDIVLPFLFLSVVRYLAFRQQFRAHLSGPGGCLQPIYTTWLEIAKPKWRPFIAAIAIALALGKAYTNLVDYQEIRLGLSWVMAAAFHMWLIYRLMESLRNEANLKLLILRVFGINETAEFTFEGLLTYWQHFGSFFTVVDPSFLGSQKRQQNRLIPLLVATFFAFIFLTVAFEGVVEANPVLFYFLVLVVTLLGAVAYVVLSMRQIDRGFVRSQADLRERLQRLEKRPRKLDLTFKSLPTMCYDNTWRMAVLEFINSSEVILMDLRGYSDERKGCEYEVDLLLDTVPIQRIVFLVDAPGLPQVQKLILERWEWLRTTSPNLDQGPTEALIYVSSKKNKEDIQGIMDILMDAAIRTGAKSVG